MHIETLIYVYLAICAAMILFNCICILYFHQRDAEQHNRGTRLRLRIEEEIQRVRAGGSVSVAHIELLCKRLGRVKNLMVLDDALSALAKDEPDAVSDYVGEIRQVFAKIAVDNHFNNPMHYAFFAYMSAKYHVVDGGEPVSVLNLMFELLEDPSLYCRENALQVLYGTGDCGIVLRALRVVDQNGFFHHQKLLCDGLVSFAGDKQELARALWGSFELFSTAMQAVVLDFIRFSGSEMNDELLLVLTNKERDDELRFSCIRYFWKHPDPRVYPLLLAFLKNQDKERWEYAAIAATALSSYPGERTIEALKRAMGSPSWYVRLNASKSLEAFHLTYQDLGDVMDGGDRYAREILQYQLDMDRVRRDRELRDAAPSQKEVTPA